VKFAIERVCECGGRHVFSTYGDAKFGTTTCTNCGKPAYLMDPLSVSVTAERLLYRSKIELEAGDYSLSILTSVMAVESYMTRLFLKLKGMTNYSATFSLPHRQRRRSGKRSTQEKVASRSPLTLYPKNSPEKTSMSSLREMRPPAPYSPGYRLSHRIA
jgi:hypothetical protein